jgi:glutathione synthase/RimK-type ligase-like ATP-grasp enzyme
MATRVALATAARLPQGMEDTGELMAAIECEGGLAERVIWTDRAIDWSRYDVVMLHSPWDYTRRVDRFLEWIDEVSTRARMVNPAGLVRWNVDKSYLLDLAAAGVAISPSARFERGRDVSVTALRERFGTPADLVLKPSIGAGGRRVARFTSVHEAAATASAEMADEPCVVQLFEPAITSRGEMSAIYVDGAITHVVRKRAAVGEFRIQGHYGGTAVAVPLEDWMTVLVQDAVAHLPERARLARVDFVAPEDRPPVIMEVEVIEPDLYLRTSAAGRRRVARLLVDREASR